MHAQVITFGLSGMTEEQYREACGADAQTFANLPGLLAKIWLRNPETNTYGGLYLWADQESYERYIKGEVFNAIKADQNLENVESRDFGVFDDLSSITCRSCAWTPELRGFDDDDGDLAGWSATRSRREARYPCFRRDPASVTVRGGLGATRSGNNLGPSE
jgi:hypothetical protein